MNKSFKYIFASALLVASFMSDAFAQRKVTAEQSEAEKAAKSVMLTKKTTPVEGVDGAYYLDLETFITGYTSNVTTYSTVTVSTPLDIVLLLDVSGSMDNTLSNNTSRISALKTAVSGFITTIKDDAVANNVDHRISLIKFAGDEYPTGTNVGTRTSYLELKNAGYSYDGYGNNEYYVKSGDDYYQVSRVSQKSDEYDPLKSASYTPKDIDGGEYYYFHTDGNYYLLKRGGLFNNHRTVYFEVGSTTWYLNGNTATKDYTTFKNNDTAFTGVLYQPANYYRLSYKAGTTTYYLSGTTETTTAPTNVKSSTETIWTGVLYNKTTTSNVPTNIVEGDDTYRSGDNTYNRTQVVKNFTSVGTGTGATDLTTDLNKLTARGGTYTNYGMNLAQLVFDEGYRDEAVKVLILFTDGEPGKSGFDNNVANPSIETSHYLKSALGVKVYTIGTFTNPSTNTTNFMNYTSSNYPDAISMTSAGTPLSEDDAKFYHNVTNASNLSSVFQTISKEASQEAANANAGYTEATTANNVAIKDIVTENFVIPSGADGEINLGNIQVWTAKSTGVTRADNFDYQNYQYKSYEWAEPVLREDLVPAAVRGTDKKTTVSVPGFDYSANWVGWEDSYEKHSDDNSTPTRKDSECTLHEGYKLILRILVEPDPDAVGGLVPTNDPASGLYITKDGTEISLKSYEVPPSVLVPMDLTIVMNGITDRGNKNLYKPGETAIFQVEGFGGKGWTVAVTADSLGHGEASIKVPFYNNAERDQFTVKEISGWSYRFNSVVDLERETGASEASASRTKQLTADDHIFYFKATDTEEHSDGSGMVSRDFQVYFYDENNKNNVFNRPTEN